MAAPHGSKIHMSRGLVASPMVYLKSRKFRAMPHNSKCRYGERGAADAKPKAQIILDAAKVSAASGGCSEPKQGSGRRVRGLLPPKHDAGTATRHYRAFWQRRCRAAAAGAVLKPSGGNCAVLPLACFLQTRLNFALKSLGIHKGFLRLFALNSPHVCETSVIFFVFRYTSLL